MKILLTLFGIAAISVIFFFNKKYNKKKKKLKEENDERIAMIGKDHDWKVRPIWDRILDNIGSELTAEGIEKYNTFKTKIDSFKKKIDAALTGAVEEIKTKRDDLIATPIPFDLFGLHGMEKDMKVNFMSEVSLMQVEFNKLESKLQIAMAKHVLFTIAISSIKPEIKDDVKFQSTIESSLESDLQYFEERKQQKLSVFEEIMAAQLQSFVKALAIPAITERFMPRLQLIPVE